MAGNALPEGQVTVRASGADEAVKAVLDALAAIFPRPTGGRGTVGGFKAPGWNTPRFEGPKDWKPAGEWVSEVSPRKWWSQAFDTAERRDLPTVGSFSGEATVLLSGREADVTEVVEALDALFLAEDLGTIPREGEIERELRLSPQGGEVPDQE
ncbi:hypothetical protein [Streptomyces sp. NPDC004788]